LKIYTNALIVDGGGADPRAGSLTVAAGKITSVDFGGDVSPKLPPTAGCETVDCAGFALAPGFIDVHSHSDTYALLRPDAPSKIAQGVTTEIVGQCGASASPNLDFRNNRERGLPNFPISQFPNSLLPSDWASHTYPCQWHDIATYTAALRAASPRTRIVPMTGHRNLRVAVMGMEPRPATPREIALMCGLLESELAGGSRGFSTGLLYQPGCHAAEDEITALCKVCARYGGVYATHLRSEGDSILEALAEAIRASRESGVQLQISHFKIAGGHNWRKFGDAVEMIEKARDGGVRVFADRYPYTASGTDLDIILPGWAQTGGRGETLARLRDPATRRRIIGELKFDNSDRLNSAMIGGTTHPGLFPLRGRLLAEIAAEWDCHAAEALVRIIEKDGLRTGGFFSGMSEEHLNEIYKLPWVTVGSDASIRAASGVLSGDHPHPRAWGAFPRFIAVCRDRKLLPLGEAIRRITSLPAEIFGLRDRGLLAPGRLADLVLFDPWQCRDTATYANPNSPPAGIKVAW